MAFFAVTFRDRPGTAALRASLLRAHLDYLAAHAARIHAAGSLRSDDGATALGGLWIVEAADRAAVEALYATDPFWTGGLRESVAIQPWSPGLLCGTER